MEGQSSQEELMKILDEELNGAIFSSQDSFCAEWNGLENTDQVLIGGLSQSNNTIEPEIMAENEDRLDIESNSYLLENPPAALYDEIFSTLGLISSSQSGHSSEAVPIGHRSPYADYRHNESTVPDTTQRYGIPSNTNWIGEYHFDISFQEQTEKMTKSTSWTYSEQMDKLFVNMGVSCIVCFKVRKLPPPGCFIRALPIFEKCDHIRNVVKRCPTHCILSDPSNQGHSAPEHLVRCDSEHAEYVTDPSDGRHSVIVPFLPPQAGTDNTQYLYKFMCLGSCVGGLNRRPLQLIFTLEHNGQVLGRRTLKVRICACPGRDRKSEESSILEGSSKKVKTLAQTTTTDVLVFEPASKRQKFDDELFTLTIQGRANYEVLLKVKESLELATLVPNDIRQAYQADQQQIIRPMATPSTSSSIANERASQPCHQPSEILTAATFTSALDQELEIPASGSRPSLQKTSSIIGETRTDARPCPTRPGVSSMHMIKKDQMELIKSWLESINMVGYVDMFAERGYKYMRQLEELMQEDIDRFPIGNAHRKLIWKALLDYKGTPSCPSPIQASNSASSQCNTTYLRISRLKIKRYKSLNISPDDG